MRNLWILTRFLLKSGPGKSNQKSGKKKAFSDGGRIVVYLLLGVCLLPVSVLLFLLGYSGYTFLQPLGLETLLIAGQDAPDAAALLGRLYVGSPARREGHDGRRRT